MWDKKILRFPGFRNKEQSDQLASNIKRLMELKENNQPPDKTARAFLEHASPYIKKKLAINGVIDEVYVAIGKHLTQHVEDFYQSLLDKEVTEKHAQIITKRVQKISQQCEFTEWRDVRGERIDVYIKDLLKQGYSKQTASFYVKAFRQFCRWMKYKKRINSIPEIKSIKVPKGFERAFEFEEFGKLLKSTRTGPVRFGLSGYQRYLVYIVAVETGLRRNELATITPTSIDFKNNTIFVKGECTKNREDAVQHISLQTAQLLKQYIKGKKLDVRLFALPDKTSKMIQQDCEAAGVKIENNKGKIKFHSLRHTCGSFLAAKGVHPKVIQDIMRHKDINLTMSRYTHTLKGLIAAAISLLPKFGATGTDG
jgi:integrase